jgi:type IV pilus assembly protein PilQ
MTLKPGSGFNSVLMNPGKLDVVIKALASSGRTKVLSAPKVLVNDNATATLASISESPFTSINHGETTETTSFGGYASAGTTISVTPHISDDEYLQLKYSLSLGSFTGEAGGSGAIPPPRQTNDLTSEITIPNGHAVIVGGLTREDVSETTTKIPWIGDLPIIKHAFRNQVDTDSKSTLFVFVRPVILRDDQFEDLKYISDKEIAAAKLPPIYPESEPILVE